MTENSHAAVLLAGAEIVFWDFDGVIKESVTVKSDAFERLFLPYGREIAVRVRRHHEENGGVSRYDKIPVYLKWAGEDASEANIQDFCSRFSELAFMAVIESPWVPGVREYIQANHDRQDFFLVTATPQEEIERILDALGIAHCFVDVLGAPKPKALAVGEVLKRRNCSPGKALVIGDSETDLAAAEANHVPFLLRRTGLNVSLQGKVRTMFEGLHHG